MRQHHCGSWGSESQALHSLSGKPTYGRGYLKPDQEMLVQEEGTQSASLFSVTQMLIKNKSKSLFPKHSVLSPKPVLSKCNRGRGDQAVISRFLSIPFGSLSGKSSPQGPLLSCCHILPRRKESNFYSFSLWRSRSSFIFIKASSSSCVGFIHSFFQQVYIKHLLYATEYPRCLRYINDFCLPVASMLVVPGRDNKHSQ